jgi:glutathione S-transferase
VRNAQKNSSSPVINIAKSSKIILEIQAIANIIFHELSTSLIYYYRRGAMKLYYSKGACSLAVRINIHEIGMPCEFEAVDLKSKKTEHGADYLKINSKGSVPALQLDDNRILTENAVIQQYIAEKNKATQLLPVEKDENRYKVLEWLNFASTDLHKSCSPLFNPNVPSDLKESVFTPLLKNKLSYLNQHLTKNKYLIGEQYTLPDAYVFVVLRWLPAFKIDLASYADLQRYFNEVKQRKAVQTSLKEEGLN